MLAYSSTGGWDRVGIGLSGLCAVHCLLMPLVLALLPLWPIAEEAAHWLHPVLGVPVVFITLRALQDGFRHHGSIAVVVLLGLGIQFVLAGVLGHNVLGVPGETMLTLIGSILLLAGHVCNGHACHSSCK